MINAKTTSEKASFDSTEFFAVNNRIVALSVLVLMLSSLPCTFVMLHAAIKWR